MAYTPLNLQNGQVLTAEDLQHMEQGILANELPPPANFQQLVTDDSGNVGWADRLAYITNVEEYVEGWKDVTFTGTEFYNDDYFFYGFPGGLSGFVSLDGMTYSVEMFDNGGVYAIGDATFANYPFFIEGKTVKTSTDGTHTLSLYGYKETIVPISSQWLPTGTLILGSTRTSAWQELVSDKNGNTGWNDRLAYKTPQEVLIQSDTSATQGDVEGAQEGYGVSSTNILASSSIVVGDTYVVRFSGTTNTLQAREVGGKKVLGSDPPTGSSENDFEDYPFSIYSSGNRMILAYDTTGSKFLSISHVETYVKQLDPDYIPALPFVMINSSTEGSVKKFKLTVDDSGTIAATEIN